MREVVVIASIKSKSILLVKKKEVWILPGGKPKTEESDADCLIRELKEELPGIRVANLKFYGLFRGKSPHIGDNIRVKVYIGDVEGKLQPSAEIIAAEWVKDMKRYKLANVTQKIVFSLKQKGHL